MNLSVENELGLKMNRTDYDEIKEWLSSRKNGMNHDMPKQEGIG